MKINSRGVTLVELMIAVAIMGIVTMAMIPILRISQTNLSTTEMTNGLKSMGQWSINRMSSSLTECKRIFENNGMGTSMLSRIEYGTAPTPMTGNRLPTIEETGSISPSTTSFVSASVGNALLFANLNPARDFTVNDSGAVARNVRIDVYTFQYYYIAENTSKYIGNQAQRQLWHWESLNYADYNQLIALTDNTTRNNTVGALYAANVRYAFDTSASTATSAFYLLFSSGGITASSTHQVKRSSAENTMDIKTGISGTTYRYGVSPNTAGANLQIKETVPRFGTASGKFPSGFEVIMVGSNSVRQIFIRMVMVAQGARKGAVSHEEQILTTVRDLW